MGDPARLAATFAFLEEVWRGRSRLLACPGLAQWVRAVERAPEGAEAAGDLLDALLPWDRGAGRVVCFGDEDLARALHGRRGVAVEATDRLATRLADGTWEVAVVDRSLLAAAGPEVEARLSQAIAAHGQRSVVLLADAGEADYDALADATLALGGGRILGVYPARIFGFVEYGDVVEGADGTEWGDDEEDAWGSDEPDADAALDEAEAEDDHEGGEGDDEEEDDDVPVAYDNTIGPAEPEPAGWVALCGASAFDPATEGLSLVEVDPAGFGTPAAGGDRAILAGREQELRWRLERAEAELAELRARPVGELEAKVAELEARLAAAKTARPNADAVRQAPPNPVHVGRGSATRPQEAGGRTAAAAADLLRGAEVLERWIRRLEAGGTVSLPALRDDLHALARHLRRQLRGVGGPR